MVLQNMSNNIFGQIYDLSKAITKQVISGCPAADDETLKYRSDICSVCPSLNKEEYRCNECGCYLKYKIAWATQECPLGKWDK